MSNLKQVEENLESANRSAANSLTKKDLNIVNKARGKYLEFKPIACTGCQYCLSCPQGINIPKIFEIYNDAVMYENPKQAREEYQRLSENGTEKCLGCLKCEKLCPQHIEISKELKKAEDLLS